MLLRVMEQTMDAGSWELELHENCTREGNITRDNTLRGNKRKRHRGTGKEGRDVSGTLTAAGSGCHHAGHDAAAGASHR